MSQQWKTLQEMEQELTAERKKAFMTTQKEAAEPQKPLLWYPPDWEETTFDPAGDGSIQNLERERGKPERLYMPCAKRLQWFLQDQRKVQAEALKGGSMPPAYTIRSEVVLLDWEQGAAVFKTIIDDVYGNHAEDYGSCTRAAWTAGFVEKAKTKSLSRALAQLGYGTQFALDYEDEDEPGDTPQPKPQQKPQPQKAEPAQQDLATAQALKTIALQQGYDTQGKRDAALAAFKAQKGLHPAAPLAGIAKDFQTWLMTHPYQPKPEQASA